MLKYNNKNWHKSDQKKKKLAQIVADIAQTSGNATTYLECSNEPPLNWEKIIILFYIFFMTTLK